MRLVLLGLVLAGCATSDVDGWVSPGTTVRSTAPYAPTTWGGDYSDHDCTVVLRDVARVPNGTGGYEVNEVGTARTYVWEGHLDVARDTVDDGAIPAVIYHASTASDTWYEVDATPTDGAPTGYQRYTFRIDEHTPTEGMSMTSLMRTEILLIPLLRTADGDRLFDHNRRPGDFDNYVLDADNLWSVADDDGTCVATSTTPWASVELRGDGSTVQHGALVPGGELVVEYDPLRLPQCFGSTYMGQRDWDTLAHVRFQPGGERIEASVLDCPDAACAVPGTLPVTVDIPAGATGAELWFSTSGRTCGVHWDSNYGDNYRFGTEASPIDPIWAGDWGYAISRGMDMRSDDVPDPMVMDSWVITRADIRYVDVEVYVPGLTDAVDRPELVMARAVVSRDGAEPEYIWMDPTGRDGNNYRYAWSLFTVDLLYTPWDELTWFAELSTDGVDWYRVGLDDGPDAATPRTILRGDDWCPTTYWGEDWCPLG